MKIWQQRCARYRSLLSLHKQQLTSRFNEYLIATLVVYLTLNSENNPLIHCYSLLVLIELELMFNANSRLIFRSNRFNV
jgi:hypothetical protein